MCERDNIINEIKVFKKEVKLNKNFTEEIARKIVNDLHSSIIESSFEAVYMALKIPLPEMPEIDTLEKAVEVYKKTRVGSLEESAAALKVAKFAKTLDDMHWAYGKIYYKSPIRKLILRNWRKVSAKEIEKATTFDDVLDAYHRAPDNTPEKKAALKKLMKFHEEKISNAKTFKEVLEVEEDVSLENPQRRIAILKMIRLSTNVIEAMRVCGKTEHGSREEAMAIRKMASFY